MKYLFFIAFLFAAIVADAQTTVYYCGAKTQAGTPCVRKVDHAGAKCWQHGGQSKAQVSGAATGAATTQCGAICKSTGLPCKNRVKGGGRCHLHRG